MERVKINIAGFTFSVPSTFPGLEANIRDLFGPFVSDGKEAFHAHFALARNRASKRNVFDIVHKWTDGKVSIRTPSFDAGIDFNNKTITVRTDDYYGVGGVLRILCSALLVKEGGFLLHAGSILSRYNGTSCIFCGPSESGKTTIARLAEDIVLSDETTAVRPAGDSYHAYATPFSGDFGKCRVENLNGPVRALFFIKKGEDFSHVRLDKHQVMGRLLVNAMARPADYFTTNSLISNFNAFVNEVPCYELCVRPVPELWRYIDEEIS